MRKGVNYFKKFTFLMVPFLKSKFTHHNIKYSIGKLIDNIIIILKTGISYRDIVSFRNIYIRTCSYYTKIHENTLEYYIQV